jgi:hypothetical protein
METIVIQKTEKDILEVLMRNWKWMALTFTRCWKQTVISWS